MSLSLNVSSPFRRLKVTKSLKEKKSVPRLKLADEKSNKPPVWLDKSI